jgi:hypothetical protein
MELAAEAWVCQQKEASKLSGCDGALMIDESDALYIQKSFAFALQVR